MKRVFKIGEVVWYEEDHESGWGKVGLINRSDKYPEYPCADEDEALAKYNGEEEAYIKDNYCIHDNFSWDYITQAQYIPDCEDTEVYEIDFENIKD